MIYIETIKTKVLSNFILPGEVIEVTSQENGLINNTYIVTTRNTQGLEEKFILQKINTTVFPNPYKVIQNITKVTEYIKRYNPSDSSLRLITCKNSAVMAVLNNDEGNKEYWRMYNYINNSFVLTNESKDLEGFRNVAIGYAQFHKSLEGFDPNDLKDTIPDFHNSRARFLALKDSVANDIANRKQFCLEEWKYLKENWHEYSYINELIEQGDIPLRVAHNDTKCNNVLLDIITKEALCVIDLDTVMRGTILFDIADAIRSGASTTKEDDSRLDRVDLDIDMVDAFLDGYFSIMHDNLTQAEIMAIPMAIYIITLELATRFLKDYLDGDVYFKTTYSEQNLMRTQNQIQLAKKIKEKMQFIYSTVTRWHPGYLEEQALMRKRLGN